jgi:hypothetical protein
LEVKIFGRDTHVELTLSQIQKIWQNRHLKFWFIYKQ